MGPDSLIAPADLARFTLAYVLLVVAPGFALATLARPLSPRTERMALSVPCAYSLVAIYGLATALLHVPFSLAAYAALALALALAAIVASWRRRKPPVERDRWWLVAAGVAAVQAGVTMLIYAPYVVPVSGDTVSHVAWTNLILHSHTFPIAMLSSHPDAGNGGFYPPAFHAVTSLVLSAAPMPTYHADFYSVMAVAALLPLALFCYVRAATGFARLGGLAALAALAFDPFPFYSVAQGFYTFAVSLLFVPVLALALRDALARGDRRAVALSAGLGIGLFYTHPTELVTVALLTLAIVPGLLRDARSWARAIAAAAIVAAAWLVAAIPTLGAVRRTMVSGAQPEIHSAHFFAPRIDLGATLAGYVNGVYARNLSYVLLVMVLIGAVWCLARRRYLGLVAIQAILFVLYIDATGYDVLHPLYVLSFPWALWERLAPTHYWFALPLAAIGIDAVARGAGRLWHAKSPLFTALIAAPLVAIGLVLPFGLTAARVAAFTHAHTVLAPADLGSLAWLARHAPASSVVVNDSNMVPRPIYDAPIDAGLWMPAMGAPQPLFFRSESGPGSLAERNDVLRHISDTALPVRVAAYIARHDVRYVFYGAAVRAGAARHLNLARLLADPHLRMVYSSTAACRNARTHGPAGCPPSASYVFALGFTKRTIGA